MSEQHLRTTTNPSGLSARPAARRTARRLAPLFAITLLGVASFGAQASQLSYCSTTSDGTSALVTPNTPVGSPVLSVSDVTYGVNGPSGSTAAAKDCYGAFSLGASNPTNETNFLNALSLWSGGFTFLDKTGADTGTPLAGLTFTVVGDINNASGSYTVTSAPLPSPSPAYFDFVVMLKSGNTDEYAAYLFDDVAFDGNSGGSFAVRVSNDNGQFRQLSHLSIFGRVGTAPPPPPPPPQEIPEPGSLATVALGLLAAGSAMRRRRKA